MSKIIIANIDPLKRKGYNDAVIKDVNGSLDSS